MRLRLTVTLVAAALLVTGCSIFDSDPAPTVTTTAHSTTSPEPQPQVTVTAYPEPESDDYARPLWLGSIPLPLRDDGLGVRQPTPEELRDRQFAPPPHLPDPASDEFTYSIEDVPADVAARSSWAPECPVRLQDLSYITMTYWGFDQKPHLGEMLIHRDHASDVVDVFKKIYEARFPIEEMRVISAIERDAHTSGDHNVTSGFTCRRVVTVDTVWSEHAKGLAIDINPFHNPFVRGDALFPELSEAYLDRDWHRPGMIHDPSVVYDAFEEIGWTWGGHWHGREDWMHFSAAGG